MPKLALITGATSGIGMATARLFAAKGYRLILAGRRRDRLDRLAEELAVHGDAIRTLCFDIRRKDAVENALQGLPPGWKEVDVLVNNAGLSQGLDPFHEADTNDWDTMIDTNVKGLLYVSNVVSKWMVGRKQGHIVNLGSIAGKETYARGNVYCATKHAVDSLNKAMRIDLLSHGIRVSAIHPGAVDTEFSEVRFKGDAERAKKVYEGYEPLHAEDVADAIWFMVSRPGHVTINEMLIMPTAQADATHLIRHIPE
jgi:NADP-dependent 3-hydroxy acid dehydrogenase YdfG